MKRDVSDIIRTLIQKQEAKDAQEVTSEESQGELTSLGVPLVRQSDKHYVIDLTNIRVFRNMQTFVQMLVDEVIEQCGFGIADIMVRRKVDPHLTPELAATGLDWIMIYVRLDAADNLPFDYHNFSNCMQVIFRALQTEKWGGMLFPQFFGLDREKAEESHPALLFPFHLHDQDEKNGNYYLVEHSRAGRFLRITIEDAANSRLQLKHIAHRVVDQSVRSSYFPDIYSTAEKIHQGLLRECMNNRSEYHESPVRLPDFFAHLQREGLPHLQTLHFSWPTDDRQMLFLEKGINQGGETESFDILLKEIQLLEDPRALQLLARGNVLEMVSGAFHLYFDVSRYGVCLNVSFDEFRNILTMDDYLARMPTLAGALAKHQEALRGVRLFVIHHITAEVIGLLKAFAEAGCDMMTTFFVKYAGIVPETYLETLMSLSPDDFRFYSLQKIESRRKLAGFYILSRQFSPLSGFEEIDQDVLDEKPDFLEAMRLASGRIFLNEILLARQKGAPVLLVEDGGYLAPLINRFCLENKSVGDVFAFFRLALPADGEDMAFASWLQGTFMGSIEHTKNGYDYNEDVMKAFGKLQYPAASIAISSLKRGREADACAMSILNATENILSRLGMLLSRRKIMVLGSAGAIGGFLKKELKARIREGHVFGVDIAASKHPRMEITEAGTIDELGKDVLTDTDMFIGVIGGSILKKKHIADIILHGRHRDVFFISGSTKTVEFSDLQDYLQTLRDTDHPQIDGKTIQTEFSALRDLQTGMLQGYQVTVVFPDAPSLNKNFYLLGELMPINFLYYGIPREIVDDVMAQLFTLSCGVVRRQKSDDNLKPALLAVDYEIDAEANDLSADGKRRKNMQHY